MEQFRLEKEALRLASRIYREDNKIEDNQITINVPLFKKLRDIIFFLRDNHFLSRFKGHFEGAKTFLTP